MKAFFITTLIIFLFSSTFAQVNKDSIATEAALEELFTVCNSAMSESENANDIIFERLAPYILYSGTDASRNNKSTCDYNKVEDRKIVNTFGLCLKSFLDQIVEFKVVKYQIVKKDNSDWYTLVVTYKPGGKNRTFCFLRMNEKFLLGKID